MLGRGRSIRRFRFTSTLLFLALPWSAAAQDLVQVYRDAQSYDAVYAAARHSVEAGAIRSSTLFETVIAPLVNAERPSRFRF